MAQKKYEIIRDQMLQEIRSGHLPPGSRLKGEVQLAEDYGVSVLTVRRAMADLASGGYILRKKRSGTFVADPSDAVFETFCRQKGIRILRQNAMDLHAIPQTAGLDDAKGVLILFSSSDTQAFSDSDGDSYANFTPNMLRQ